MKRGGAHSSIRFVHVFLVLLAVALAGLVSQGQFDGAYIFQNSGYSYGGYGSGGGFFSTFSFMNFYAQYAPFIDAFLFLIIFLSVGKTILGKHFQQGGQALYIGIGALLALSLLFWEEQSGFHILEKLGPYSGFLLILIVLVVTFRLLREGGSTAITALSFAYILFYFFFNEISEYNVIAQNIYSRYPTAQEFIDLFFYLAIGGLIFGIILAIITHSPFSQRGRDRLETLLRGSR